MKTVCSLPYFCSACCVALGWVTPAAAQSDYPSKPVTMIVPFPAGGRTDLVGRIVAQELTRKSASRSRSSTSPAQAVCSARAKSPIRQPDGYTLGFFSTSAVTSQYTVPTPISLSNFELVAIVNTDPPRWPCSTRALEDAQGSRRGRRKMPENAASA